ncbi:transcription initiation factor TFIID subunit 4b isoform X2 [Cucurbita pepo subsp. pepo]|uniref:transcription initiation factor TFIID subunit 4b isoform X2 n=1 Tax=Cucurbita pepo subsp. pepo TaxID=3664 RepID=UPI000C9D9F4D|nr:transcription initiation factor TFIID subunit 4b isoform X2 [Cucurbita pepo subsp. pepo]
MDPSIMKLLEDDEDETMHSGAAVEAFQAALNRDIEGDVPAVSQAPESDAAFPRGSNGPSSLSLQASQNEKTESHAQQDQNFRPKQEQHSSLMELERCSSLPENQQQHNAAPLQASKNQPQADREQGDAEQVSAQFSQTAGLQGSEKAPILVNDSNRMQNRDNESQYLKLQKMSNQQTMVSEQANNPLNRSKQVPFASLMPVLMPQLDKDRAMQLQTLFNRLKRNEMNKDDFIRLMRGVVGDQMLRLAVCQVQAQPPPSVRQLSPRMPSMGPGAPNFSDPRPFSQLHQKGMNSPAVQSYMPSSASQGRGSSGYPAMDKNMQSLREVEQRTDGNANQLTSSSSGTIQERERSSIPVPGLEKQQLHFQQKSFPMYGNSGNYHPYTGSNINTSSLSLKPQPHEGQAKQISQQAPNFDRQVSINDPKRVQGGNVSHLRNNLTSQPSPWKSSTSKEQNTGPLSSMSYIKQEPSDQVSEQNKTQHSNLQGLSSIPSMQAEQVNTTPGIAKDPFEKQTSKVAFPTSNNVMPQSSTNAANPISSDANSLHESSAVLSSQVPSATTPGMQNRAPQKKGAVGQKKPLEALGSSPPLSSKKQKVSGAFSDQSIEQLNDVTAVSGVNIREEEEQLFSSAKEDSRASEASRKVVQEEEERLLLQKAPLQKKLMEIMAKYGLKSMSNDVEKCLSLSVEERLRGIISNLIRLSKQRVDTEKPRHRTHITSDVRQQIMLVNQKAREEWEKKQAEEEKLRKLNDPEDGSDVAGDKDKDEGRMKSVNKEEDDKMRTTAANVAARAAVGGDDMLSKWQLMAEQARQKREGGMDSASGSQSGKDTVRKSSSAAGRHGKDNQEGDRKGTSKKFGRNQMNASQTRVARSISVKDVIAVLQREPQMSRSTTIYRLFNKVRSEATGE